MADEFIRVRVWDLPTRCFHWALALCVVASVTCAWLGGNAMAWHFWFGYALLALLAFRVLWGLVGGHWSRFVNIVHAPATVLRYLRGKSDALEHHDVGHSPLGALSVFGLLALLGVQAGSGLFADDEIADSGPLIKFVSSDTSHALTQWHTNYGQWLIIALVLLHVGAILFYLFGRKRNLVRPMWTGDKLLAPSTPASVDSPRSRALAALLLAVCAAGIAWLVSLGN